LFAIQREKKNQDYVKYLEAMFNYLYNYMERVKPLVDLQAQMDEAHQEFEKKWTEGVFPGWPVLLITIYDSVIYNFNIICINFEERDYGCTDQIRSLLGSIIV
jgi:hypothetical protein